MSILADSHLKYAEWRQKLRKHLWRRGSRKLNSYSSRDYLAGFTVKVFGQYSTKISIFDYLLTQNSNNADEIVFTKLGQSKALSMIEALLETLDLKEQGLILNHLQIRDKSFRDVEAERLRNAISLFCRSREHVSPASSLETQMSQAAALGILQLLRLRRHAQARDFVCFSSMQIAALMILGDDGKL